MENGNGELVEISSKNDILFKNLGGTVVDLNKRLKQKHKKIARQKKN